MSVSLRTSTGSASTLFQERVQHLKKEYSTNITRYKESTAALCAQNSAIAELTKMSKNLGIREKNRAVFKSMVLGRY